ncbi:hypothetical protein PIROE2DRAFT_65651 [Piromyces sp. E2]|nr:hypothetical protein PIROE2DRAFT_65651 [Piromyces sp. E2]|eukprot:OUM56235.1 hypothetical protein PIROE2DRAFT_65651 [Piromyces sp. E2]
MQDVQEQEKDKNMENVSENEIQEAQEQNNTAGITINDSTEIENNNKEKEQLNNNKNNENASDKNNKNKKETQPIEKSKTITKRNMTEIQMINPDDKFNILKEVNNLYPQITLAQLLSASPALRKELEKGIKPKTETIMFSFNNSNIPLIIGEIQGKYLRILYDTGANINVITIDGFNKLDHQEIEECEEEENITIANGATVSTKIFTTLKININNSCTVVDKFYVIDHNNPHFDVIFGRGLQKKYRLFIDPDDDFIYQKTKNDPRKITKIISNKDISDNKIPLMNSIIMKLK